MHNNDWNDNKLDWSLVLPPSRPSEYGINILYRYFSEDIRDSNVCILGSTPELREFSLLNGAASITIIEKSKLAYKSFSTSMVLDNKNEKLVWGDWLNILPKMKNKFDFVFGDLVSGNVPYEHQYKFYEALYKTLNTNGKIYERILKNINPLIRIDDIINKYSRPPINLLRLTEFVNELFFLSTVNENTPVIKPMDIEQKVLNMTSSAYILKYLKMAKSILPFESIWYYSTIMEDISLSCHSKFARNFQRLSGDDPIYRDRIEYRISQR